MSQRTSHALGDTARCLSNLLSQLGVEASPHALTERLGPEPTPESWARQVRAHGRSARLVRVTARSLSRLSLPTLLLGDAAPPCVLRELRGSRALIERADGAQQQLPVERLVPGESAALEVGVSLAGLGSLRARFVHLLGNERRALLQLGAIVLLVAGLGLLTPLLTREVMDRALPDHAPRLLVAVVLAVLLSGVTRAWLSVLRERLVIALNGRNSYVLARDGLAHTLGLSFPALSAQGLGASLQFLASSEGVARLASVVGVRPLLEGAIGLASLVMLATSAPLLGASLVGAASLVLVVALLLAGRHAAWRRTQLSATTRERARLHEIVSGIATIKALGAERRTLTRWLGPMLEQSTARLRADLLASWYALWFGAFARGSRVAVFVWGAHGCLAGELSVGAFVALAMLADNFTGSLGAVGEALLIVKAVSADVESIDAVLAKPSEPLSAARSGARVDEQRDVVVLDDVWFRYAPDQPWILRGYSLRLGAGEQLTLRSASGTGKTTVLRLIAGLYRPERGTVTVFGRDPAQVRSQIAYLPQHAHLFAGSLLHNLQLLSGASLENIVRASQVTGLAGFVATLPMGFETIVPAGGSNLSGGQRQWVLLTAALASERRLLLMDEALANLDNLTRARLRSSASFGNKSVIWVSHED